MKRIIVHICLGLLVLVGVIYTALQGLDKMTRHGETILVPDMRSFSIYEVEDTLNALHLRFSVVDSGAYNADYPRGSVIEQLPKFGSRVKKNRELYLTVNPKNVSLISLPNYTDRSSRQYISELRAKGFRLGKFIYKNDEHANVVLGVKYLGQTIKVEDKLEKATKLDLVIGNGNGMQIEMPNLIALSQRNMKSRLSAFVYKQKPEEGTEEIDLGAFVNLWFTEDSSNLVVDTLELMRQDSLKARLDSILND